MTRMRNTFVIPAQLLSQLQAFARELCELAVEKGDGVVLLSVDSQDRSDVESHFHVRLIGHGMAVKELRRLCLAAEQGQMRYPQPVNKKSRAVGQPGEKINTEVELYSLTHFDSFYGHTYIYRFRDVFGNELSWRTTPKSGRVCKRGHYVLTGKVKEHHVEKGTIVTRLNYVTLKEKVQD
jgi:hypothetical protein